MGLAEWVGGKYIRVVASTTFSMGDSYAWQVITVKALVCGQAISTSLGKEDGICRTIDMVL